MEPSLFGTFAFIQPMDVIELQSTSQIPPVRRQRVLILADDISEQGGIRTRIFGEMSLMKDFADLEVLAKVRLSKIGLVREAISEASRAFPGIRFRFVPSFPHGNIRVLREVVTLLNTVLFAVAGSMFLVRRRPAAFYAHNSDCMFAGALMGAILRVPLTVDLHGDEIEENVSVNAWKRGGLRHKLWLTVSRVALRRSESVVCVSHAHKSFIERVYRLGNPVVVIPCCIEAQAIHAAQPSKTPLPLDDQLFKSGKWVLYSGSSLAWQLIDKMVSFCETLCRTRTDVHFLFLMADESSVEKVRRMFASRDIDHAHVISVKHEMVHPISSKADFALLFREDVPLNNIASPTKFAEYLAAGLPVLITEKVGDYSGLVISARLGAVVKLDRIGDGGYVSSLVDGILDDGSIRTRCRDYAMSHLVWEAYREALQSACLPGK